MPQTEKELIKDIENMVEDSFPDDLQTQNYIFTQLFNHIQARFLNQEMINKPTELCMPLVRLKIENSGYSVIKSK